MLFASHAEMVLVPEVYQPHNSPEIVDPVGVVERHAPAVWLGRKTAQEEDSGASRQKGFEGVSFCFHSVKLHFLREISD